MRHASYRVAMGALLLAPLVLASCSGVPLRELNLTRLHHYEAHAGKPVDKLVWRTGYKRLSPLSADKLLVWTDLNTAYLVTVLHPCTDLMFARHIGITTTIDTVRTNTDYVVADGWRCMIKTIQPIRAASMSTTGGNVTGQQRDADPSWGAHSTAAQVESLSDQR